MRDYAKVSPHFWTGSTGKQLRKCPESIVVSMYLMTCPHANMLGLYYMPILYVSHETGLGIEGASKGLQWACEAGFCSYDESTEMVWVHEMARFQIAENLKATDKRSIGVQNEYNSLPSNPYLASFFDKYSQAFCMTEKRENSSKKSVKSEAPCKPLVSQEQEQEQEQDNTHTQPATKNQTQVEEQAWLPDQNMLLNVIRESVGVQAQSVLDMPDYKFHLGNFNAHWENKISLTENQRTRKFAAWLIAEFKKPQQAKFTKNNPAQPNRNVNDKWKNEPQSVVGDCELVELPEGFV